jgi:citrate synthase
VTVDQVIGGMRGVKAMFYDTSKLDAYTGINFRGHSIPDLQENLPTAGNGCLEALPEGVIWLLYGDSFPTQTEFEDVQNDLRSRCELGEDVLDFIKRLPKETHPLT